MGNDALLQYKNQCARAVNVQTRAGGQRAKTAEFYGMVTSVWEDARRTASKSAQLLHALATLQRDELNGSSGEGGEKCVLTDTTEEEKMGSCDKNTMMEELITAQKGIQALLGKHWEQHQHNLDDIKVSDHLSLPPMQVFDPLLIKLQAALN